MIPTMFETYSSDYKPVVSVLDLAAGLPHFERLREGRALSFQWAFHLALLVDSLAEGDYTASWRQGVVDAFLSFKKAVAEAQLHYRQTKEMLPHYAQFGRLLAAPAPIQPTRFVVDTLFFYQRFILNCS